MKMQVKQTTLGIAGRNKTGVSNDPALATEMLGGREEFQPSSRGDGLEANHLRVRMAKEGEPFASAPPKPEGSPSSPAFDLLLDKLGERLQYERTGVRLYQALLSKYDAYGSFVGGPDRGAIAHILDEEQQHFELLWQSIEECGADPTAMTPSASFWATATKGINAVFVDPRTNLLQCLEAALTVEAGDNECWDALTELAMLAGMPELAARCEQALANEQEHLELVRRWLAAGQGRDPDRAVMGGDDVALRDHSAGMSKGALKSATDAVGKVIDKVVGGVRGDSR